MIFKKRLWRNAHEREFTPEPMKITTFLKYFREFPAAGPRYGKAGLVRFPGKQEINAAAKASAGAAALIVMGVWGHQPPSYAI